jgi:hypothetical protein
MTVSLKETEEKTQNRGEGDMNEEAEIGVMGPETKECWQPPARSQKRQG